MTKPSYKLDFDLAKLAHEQQSRTRIAQRARMHGSCFWFVNRERWNMSKLNQDFDCEEQNKIV